MIIEVDEFIILAYHLSRSNVHESQTFEDVWNKLPGNVVPIRSLADSAYVGNDCLAVARQHGATPLHKIKINAKNFNSPETAYEKLTNFAHHWPKRFAELTAKRAHSEAVFSMIGILLGHRLRCRKKAGRKNAVQVKLCLFNLIQLATREEFWLHYFCNRANVVCNGMSPHQTAYLTMHSSQYIHQHFDFRNDLSISSSTSSTRMPYKLEIFIQIQ